MSETSPTPGWYPDPWNPGHLRWWDGVAWTAHSTAPSPLSRATNVPAPPPENLADDPALRWTLPVGRSGWAIAAGYAGLFAVLIVPAPLALVLGIVAVRHVKTSGKLGMGRAVFGLVMGALGTIVLALIVLSSMAEATVR